MARRQAEASRTPSGRQGRVPPPPRPSGWSWVDLSDEELLEVRLCELDLKIKGTDLQAPIAEIRKELAERNLRCRPHFWLSDDWFTPDGIAGVAIPFYLAHPRLMQLEERQMLEVEGGTPDWCMRILRHEMGHAVANAYRLNRRRKWSRIFGKSSAPYPDYYQPRPYSKSFVLHLDSWYAQSHPTEDFAETFAVWLTPGSMWAKRYAGWPALKKLEYVDELMAEIGGRDPPVASRRQICPLRGLHITLGEHYARKRARYGEDYPDFYDRDLRKLFADARERAGGEPAARFLRRIRRDLRRNVARWTGVYQYTTDQVLKEMIARCQELKLWRDRSEEEVKIEANMLLTVQTMNYLHSGGHRVAL